MVYPSYKLDVNIGTTLNALGRRTEAAEHYESFLRQAGSEAPVDTVKEVRTSLDELRQRLASVEVSCPVSGAAVELDGQSVGQTPLGRRLYLEPGEHRLAVRREGNAPFSLTRSFVAGEHRSVLVPWLVHTPPATAPAPTHPASSAVRPPAAPAGEDPRRRQKNIWAWSALGAGGAFVVGAAVLYGVGKSRGDAAHQRYMAATVPQEIERQWDEVGSAQRLVVGGHVLAGLAAVAVGFSIYALVTRPPAQAAPRDVSLAPALSPGGGGVIVNGRF